MRNLLHRLLFLFMLLLSFRMGITQSADQYDRWMAVLSAKKDPLSKNYNELFTTLYEQDSQNYCVILQKLKSEGPADQPRYTIRLNMLEGQMLFYFKDCPGSGTSVDLFKKALQVAYEINDEVLLFDLHRLMTMAYTNQINFGSATMHALLAIDLADKLGRENVNMGSNDWYLLGWVLFHSREYYASIRAVSYTHLTLPTILRV